VIIHVIKMALYFYGLPPQNPYTYFNYEKKKYQSFTTPAQYLSKLSRSSKKSEKLEHSRRT
jgi:hypothetical protein